MWQKSHSNNNVTKITLEQSCHKISDWNNATKGKGHISQIETLKHTYEHHKARKVYGASHTIPDQPVLDR